MSSSFQGRKMSGGEEWGTQYGDKHWGNAKIRREFLRGTLDNRDPYEELYTNLRLHGRETIFDGGCNDGDDELYLRIEREHLGPLIGMEVPPEHLTFAGIQDDNRFVITHQLIERNAIKNIHFLYGYLQSIPLPDNYADRSLALWSLIHVPEEEVPIALSELERITSYAGMVAIGTNDFGHTNRKHKVLSQLGEVLGTKTPKPFSDHFRLSDVADIVADNTNLLHLPHLSIHQDTQLPIREDNLDSFVRMVNTYKNSSDPVPRASQWMEALVQTDEYLKITQEIADKGFALETVKRGIEIFLKPR